MKKQYKTKQKELILDCLERNKNKHLTAEDIITQLKNMGNNVSKATVYRYLDTLINDNIVQKFIIDETSSACYQLNDIDKSQHVDQFHIKCRICGKLMHIQCDKMEELFRHVDEVHGFKIDAGKTVFYGCCNKCQKLKEKK